MTKEEFTQEIQGRETTNLIREFIKNDLFLFLIGEKYGLAYQMPIKTEPDLVCEYLHIFLTEGIITNKQINESLSRIDVSKKENVWLVMYYIEAQKALDKDDYYVVKIDVPMLEQMLNEKADTSMKNDYTVNRIRERVKEKYNYDINF